MDFNLDQFKAFYPEDSSPKEYFYFSGGYDEILSSCGVIVDTICKGDYQGDYFYILRNEGQDPDVVFGAIGWSQQSYGSCSGCDTLQGLDSLEDVLNFRNEVASCICWFGNPIDFCLWAFQHDWVGDHTYYLDDRDGEPLNLWAQRIATEILEKSVAGLDPDTVGSNPDRESPQP